MSKKKKTKAKSKTSKKAAQKRDPAEEKRLRTEHCRTEVEAILEKYGCIFVPNTTINVQVK